MRSITSTSQSTHGRAKVFLDTTYVTIVDKDWVISSIRRTMAEQGVLLENNKDKAQVIVEAAFGVYGTDYRDTTTGLPGVGVATSLTGPTLTRSCRILPQLFRDQPARRGRQSTAVCLRSEVRRLVWESAPAFNAKASATTSYSAMAPTG